MELFLETTSLLATAALQPNFARLSGKSNGFKKVLEPDLKFADGTPKGEAQNSANGSTRPPSRTIKIFLK
jgi:hypothetical protein